MRAPAAVQLRVAATTPADVSELSTTSTAPAVCTARSGKLVARELPTWRTAHERTQCRFADDPAVAYTTAPIVPRTS